MCNVPTMAVCRPRAPMGAASATGSSAASSKASMLSARVVLAPRLAARATVSRRAPAAARVVRVAAEEKVSNAGEPPGLPPHLSHRDPSGRTDV